MKHAPVIISAAVSLALLLAGCSSGPSQMFQLTQKARTEATNEHADQYAADYWREAEKSWQEANAKLEVKSYGEADNLLLRAKANYVKARDLAKNRREELVKKIRNTQITIEKRLKSDLLDNPASAKLPVARKKEFEASVKEIQDNQAKIETQIQNDQLAEAEFLANKTLRAIYEAQQEYLKK
jgi:outer membrane murein-binding lipoprotein Lpp